MPNECRGAARRIDALAHGALAPRERRWLDRHVARCASCAASLADAQDIDRRVAAWAAPTPADDPGEAFTASVLREIAAAPAAPRREAASRGWWPAGAAAAACVLAASGAGWHALPLPALPHLAAVMSAPPEPSLRLPPLPELPAAPDLPFLLDRCFGSAAGLPRWIDLAAAVAVAMNGWFFAQVRTRREGARR